MATLIVPRDVPSANVDAEALRTAFKGIDSNSIHSVSFDLI